MTLGGFAAIVALQSGQRKIETFDDLAGISRTRPAVALVLAICLFSLTGLPPTAGFLGKLNLFLAAWGQGTESGQWLAIWLAVNAAIGAWYYLKLIGAMYFRDPVRTNDEPTAAPATIAMALCTVATIGLFFMPGWLWSVIQRV